MTDSWFRNMPPRMAVSIAPVPQDRPPLWLPILALALGASTLVGFVLWAWM